MTWTKLAFLTCAISVATLSIALGLQSLTKVLNLIARQLMEIKLAIDRKTVRDLVEDLYASDLVGGDAAYERDRNEKLRIIREALTKYEK